MTSRAHNEPSVWMHESRARSLPASGAYSHELSSARFPPAGSMQGRGARSLLRPLDPTRLPEHRCRIGLPSREQRFVIGSLAMLPPAKRVLHPLNIHSHLRRVSVLAPVCRFST